MRCIANEGGIWPKSVIKKTPINFKIALWGMVIFSKSFKPKLNFIVVLVIPFKE